MCELSYVNLKDKMEPLVSVVIPCYNGESTIDRAISSVFEQVYENIELIIVDDGSTDKSKERVHTWKQKFDSNNRHLLYVYQENQGLGGAINTGLKHVSGDFLMLLDADDQYLPGAIDQRIDFFQSHPQCNVVRSNGYIVRGDRKFLFVYDDTEKSMVDIFPALLRGTTNNWAGSYMVRTSALFSFYPNREIFTSRYGQNLQLLLPVVYQSQAGFIDQPLMNYIQQENSLSQIADNPEKEKAKKLDNAQGYRQIREYMLKQIVYEPEKFARFDAMISAGYWRSLMMLGIEYDDRALLKNAKSHLKETTEFNIQDRITYYKKIFPPMSIFWRVINKLS